MQPILASLCQTGGNLVSHALKMLAGARSGDILSRPMKRSMGERTDAFGGYTRERLGPIDGRWLGA